jgi:sporulation protein YlmC with PRC-barrel domain
MPTFQSGDILSSRHIEEFIMSEVLSINSGTLIPADKINGTDVYNMAGERLGNIEDIVIDKVSGRAIYALMSFGGLLGIGEKQYPLPWSVLNYDPIKAGYVVNLDKNDLIEAPSYHRSADFQWTSEYGRQIDHHYNAPSFWA